VAPDGRLEGQALGFGQIVERHGAEVLQGRLHLRNLLPLDRSEQLRYGWVGVYRGTSPIRNRAP